MNDLRLGSSSHLPSRCRAVVFLVAATFTFSAAAHSQSISLDTLAIRGDTYFLSHDLLLGRKAGSHGANLAALYIGARCNALGLQPVDGDYWQSVPLEQAVILPETHLATVHSLSPLRWWYPEVVPNLGTHGSTRDFQGHAVYVGTSEQISGGALNERDIRGTVAVTLGESSRAAIDTLRHHGVSGLVHLILDSKAFEVRREQLGVSRLYHADTAIASSFMPDLPSVIAGPSASRALARAASLSDPTLAPQPLAIELVFRYRAERSPVVERNVVCALTGKDPHAADSAIVLAAHYDHLGIGPPDGRGDSIYNGFSDNAAGVAMLLALARAFGSDELRPVRHTLVFLFAAAEEVGLLGSDYYVARPVWPLDRTLAVINLDAGAPPAPPNRWELAGVDSTDFGRLAVRIAAAQGWTAVTSPPRPISDFYPFARKGVPAMLIIPGAGPFERLSADSSGALRQRWDRYHQPSDEWSAEFPLGGIARYADYARMIIRAIDDRR